MASRKNRGGLANFRGNTFEQLFGIWRLVRATSDLLDGAGVRVALQLANCLVDDWVEDRKAERTHYQLKNKNSPSWGEVRADFVRQMAKRMKGKRTNVALVVRSETQARKLKAASNAVVGAEVLWFPKSIFPREVVRVAFVKQDLLRACVVADPTASDIEVLWAGIDSAWQNIRQPGRFTRVSRLLSAFSDQSFPPLRFAWRKTQSFRAAEKLLRRVPGLSFRVVDGHFSYDDHAGTTGRMSCRTSSFRKFVRRVLKQRPSTLNAVRQLL